MWLKPVLAPLVIWLDNKLENGIPNDAREWWLNLGVTGDQYNQPNPKNYCYDPTVGINRKQLRSGHYIDPKTYRISYFAGREVPLPDAIVPVPTDRQAVLGIAVNAIGSNCSRKEDYGSSAWLAQSKAPLIRHP